MFGNDCLFYAGNYFNGCRQNYSTQWHRRLEVDGRCDEETGKTNGMFSANQLCVLKAQTFDLFVLFIYLFKLTNELGIWKHHSHNIFYENSCTI